MATFGQMKTWVSKRLLDPLNTSVSSSDVGELINMAQNYWQKRRFWFNEVVDSTTLTQGDNSVPLPSDFLAPSIDNAFVIEYSGIRYPLKKVSESQYNAMYLSNGVGQPFWFARQATSGYKVYPIPDRAYTLLRFYLRSYADFSADSDTNDFSENANLLLQYSAAAYGMRDFLQDQNMYNAFVEQSKSEYQNLLLQTRKDNATGSLAINSMITF